jgi:hypothetical protein
MLALLSKIANVRRFVATFYLAWLQLPAAPEKLLTRSRRIYTVQCIALALLVSSGSSFLIDWYVGDHRAQILSTLNNTQLKLSELVKLQKEEKNRRFVQDNIKIFGLEKANLADSLQQLSRANTFSRIVSPAVYPLIVGAASLVFAFVTTRRATEDFEDGRTLFHFSFVSFVTLFTIIFVPMLVSHTQFSFIYEITRVRDFNLECWLGVSDPEATKLLVHAAQSIANDTGVFYKLERAVEGVLPYILALLILCVAWTLIRIKLLTKLPTRKVLLGSFCAMLVYTTFNVVYAAVAPSYAWVQLPPEPCIDQDAG